jgi:hypothetical protein
MWNYLSEFDSRHRHLRLRRLWNTWSKLGGRERGDERRGRSEYEPGTLTAAVVRLRSPGML